MARVMVLMWGLVLTWFAAVEFFWTPASTCAAVYVVAGTAAESAAAAWGGVTAWALPVAKWAVSARAAAPARATRVRIDGMGWVPPSIVSKVS